MKKNNKLSKWLKATTIFLLFFFIVSLGLAFPVKTASAGRSESQPISNLKVGDKVMDPSWNWEHRVLMDNYTKHSNDITKPVTWVVVAKNHYSDSKSFSTGFAPGNHVTLLTEQLIAKYAFDDSTNVHSAGRNAWIYSGAPNAEHGARKFLNEVFYNEMSAAFKSVVIETKLVNRAWDSGDYYLTDDKVFLPSSTELGDQAHNNTYEIGKNWGVFKSDAMRTAEAEYFLFGGSGTTTDKDNYWTRSPDSRLIFDVKFVSAITGEIQEIQASNGYVALRPVVNINAATRVSMTANADGVYTIVPGELEDDDDNGDDNGDIEKTVSLTANPEGSAVAGETFTFTAAAEGFDNAEYAFYYKLPGRGWTQARSYAQDPSWERSTTYIGNVQIGVAVREVGSSEPFEVTSSIDYTFTAAPPVEEVTLTADPPDRQQAGEPMTFTAEVTAGNTNAEFAFYYKVPGGDWTPARPYSTDPSWTISTTYTGAVQIGVIARAVGSTAFDEDRNFIDYEIY